MRPDTKVQVSFELKTEKFLHNVDEKDSAAEVFKSRHICFFNMSSSESKCDGYAAGIVFFF